MTRTFVPSVTTLPLASMPRPRAPCVAEGSISSMPVVKKSLAVAAPPPGSWNASTSPRPLVTLKFNPVGGIWKPGMMPSFTRTSNAPLRPRPTFSSVIANLTVSPASTFATFEFRVVSSASEESMVPAKLRVAPVFSVALSNVTPAGAVAAGLNVARPADRGSTETTALRMFDAAGAVY